MAINTISQQMHLQIFMLKLVFLNLKPVYGKTPITKYLVNLICSFQMKMVLLLILIQMQVWKSYLMLINFLLSKVLMKMI